MTPSTIHPTTPESRAPTPNTPSGDSPTSARNQARRFEKRYHTVSGETETAKNSVLAGVIGPAIVKRFSWNVGSQRKISKLNDSVNVSENFECFEL